MELQKILERIAPTQRLVYTGNDKPDTYIIFQRIIEQTQLSADDEPALTGSLYRVTLYTKGDFTDPVNDIITALRANGFYINAIEGENYETDTAYYQVPITVQYLKKEG